MKLMTLIVAGLLPTLAVAQDAGRPRGEPNAPTPEARIAPPPAASGIRTFKPTPFEQKLFLNPDQITETDGEGVFNALCAGCHMPDHKGATGAGTYPALAGNDKLTVGDYIVSVIVNGQKGMPPFADILNDAQIVAVATYLQKDFPPADVVPVTTEMVEEARAAAGPVPQ